MDNLIRNWRLENGGTYFVLMYKHLYVLYWEKKASRLSLCFEPRSYQSFVDNIFLLFKDQSESDVFLLQIILVEKNPIV